MRSPDFWRSGRDSPAGSKTVHRTVFAGVAVALFESLPLNTVPKKRKNAKMRSSVFWRSGRDSNPRYAFDVHTISSRARYDRFDTTPYAIVRGGRPRFGSIVVGQSSLISIYQNIEFVNCFFHFFREALCLFYRFPRPLKR